MVQYVLAEKFDKFLQAAPLTAARTVIDCLTPTILWQHVIPHLNKDVTPKDLRPDGFEFRGGTAHILPDTSFIWDESFRNSKPEEMADTLFNFLGRESAQEPPVDLLDEFMRLFRDEAIPAFFWRRLLEVGAQHPKVYAERLYELCVAEPILRSTEALHALGTFIESAAGLWSRQGLMAVEEAILALPGGTRKGEEMKGWEVRRNKLIARIPQNLLQTDAARKLRAEMEAANAVPDNTPPFGPVAAVRGGPITDEMWVAHKGASPDKPANRALLDLGKPLGRWATEWHNKRPDKAAREQIAHAVMAAYEALVAANDADEPVLNTVWTHLASACEAIARAQQLPVSEREFAKKVLLQAALQPTGTRSEEDDASYSFPGWGSSPQSSAAIGLIWLAGREPDPKVLDMIWRLATELRTGVRSPTVHYLEHLYRARTRKFYWELVKKVADSETNRVAEVLVKLEKKVAPRGSRRNPDDVFVPLVVGLAIAKEQRKAIEMTSRWLERPLTHAPLLSRAALSAMDFVTPKLICDERRKPEVARAIDWVLRAVASAARGLVELREKVSGPMNDEQTQLFREVYGVLDNVVSRVYFESGVFEHRSKNEEPVTSEQQKMYYPTVKPLLESVLDHTEASKGGILLAQVAHYFMQYLNGALRLDPPGILHMAVRVVANSVAAGYNLDSLAVQEVIKMAEVILADYRDLVQEGHGLDDLLTLLDAFADAGWPDANRLVWRLDDIFR